MKFEIKEINKNKFLKNELGIVVKLLSNKNCKFRNIREIYLTSVNKNKIKGWNIHSRFTTNLFLITGKINLYIGKDHKNFKKFTIYSKRKKIIKIYPKTYFAFEGLGEDNIFLSMSSGIHNKKVIKKIRFKKND